MDKRLFQKYFTGGFFLNAPLVTNSIVALATLPIILANLPIADYGKWQFVLALQIWLVASTAANITTASKKGIAQELNGTFFHAFLARLKLLVPVGILALVAAFCLEILGQHIFSVLLVIVGVYLVFGYLFQTSFYEFLIAKKRFKDWCFWQILISSVAMIGSALVALVTKDITYFALFQLGSSSVLGWIGWFWMVRRGALIDSYKKGGIDKECVPYGLKLIPVDLVIITAGKISHFVIGPFFGFANLAIFSVAYNMRDKCAGIMKSARPLLYADFAKMERKELVKIINRYSVKVGALSALLTLGFIGAGWFYIKFFLPETFHQAIIYFMILALGLPPGILGIILSTVLESHLRYKELAVAAVVPNLLRITLILILGYFWQIIGICVALAISGWIDFGFYYLLTLREDLAVGVIDKCLFLKRLSEKY